MQVQIRYFASVREALGEGQLVEVPAGITLGELRTRLMMQSPTHAAVLSVSQPIKMALNFVMAEPSLAIESQGDHIPEVAFFPPVTGG